MVKISVPRTLSVSIGCPAVKAYKFLLDPRNLPQWAAGFCKSIKKVRSDWIAETLQGPMKVRFVEKNNFGVLDHYVTIAPRVEVHVPMRVLPNGAGSEVLFTIFRLPGMSDEQFAEDVALVKQDLRTLKGILEK